MNDFSKRFRFILRWCLLAGVLAGLCFSSSEGIQLLPFPEPADAHTTNNISFEGRNLKSYSLSVHNSANLGKSGGNVQKNVKFFDGGDDFFRDPQFVKLSRKLIVRNYFEPTFSKNAGLTAAPSDRAPPIV